MDRRQQALLRQFLTTHDIQIAYQLFQARYRSGELSAADIELLAYLEFEPAVQAYGALGRKGRPRLHKRLWQELGHVHGVRITASALGYIFLQLFNQYDVSEAPHFEQLKDTTQNLLQQLQQWNGNKIVDNKAKRLLSNVSGAIADMYNVDEDYRCFSPVWHSLTTYADPEDRRYMWLGASCTTLSDLMNMTAPQKANTFYKTALAIFDFVTQFMAEELSGWTLFSVEENCHEVFSLYRGPEHRQKRKKVEKHHKALEKAAKQELHQWILPAALSTIFMTSSVAPSLGAKTEEYYANELKAGRFSYIRGYRPKYGSHHADVIPGIKSRDDRPLRYDDPNLMEAPISKVEEQFYGISDDTDPEFIDDHKFIVWNGNRKEAVERARKLFYYMLGYIPDFHVYPRMYGKTTGMDLLAEGLHEDKLPEAAKVKIPEDVIDLSEFDKRGRPIPSWRLSPKANEAKTQKDRAGVLHIATKLANERPDLYS